jgi:hypothetical protein
LAAILNLLINGGTPERASGVPTFAFSVAVTNGDPMTMLE